MLLFLLTQDETTGYDTYDSCVVAAETADAAKMIRPDTRKWGDDYFTAWARSPDNVGVTCIGVASPGIVAGVIVSSFNAG